MFEPLFRLVSALSNAFSLVVEWCIDALIHLGKPLFDAVFAAMPNVTADIAACIHWFKVANAWLPITEGLLMFTAWLYFLVVFLTIKAILKLVPFIG